MIPLWLFLILFGVIGWLLYLTRANQKTFIIICRDRIRKFNFRSRKGTDKPVTLSNDSVRA